VWVCPVCAAKITERRREELQRGIATFTRTGGTVYLVTLTFPHQQEDNLSAMLTRLAKARGWLRGGKAAAALRAFVDLQGTIRALEVTYGEAHSWHPHVHELWLMVHPPDPAIIQERLYERWHYAAIKAGFAAPTRERGIKVSNGDHAASYASKWGLDAEMTKSHLKRGRSDRYTPFDFLRFYADGHDQDRNAALFRAYAAAFAGRQQLRWSKGLKADLSLRETSDTQLNTENREIAELLGRIGHQDWVLVRQAGLRGVLLEVARGGWAPVEELLAQLRNAAAGRASLFPRVAHLPYEHLVTMCA
jgi:hypothetical protein